MGSMVLWDGASGQADWEGFDGEGPSGIGAWNRRPDVGGVGGP